MNVVDMFLIPRPYAAFHSVVRVGKEDRGSLDPSCSAPDEGTSPQKKTSLLLSMEGSRGQVEHPQLSSGCYEVGCSE